MKLYITGIALAFNDTLHYHPTLVDIIKNYFDLEDLFGTFPLPAYKMAYVGDNENGKYK